MNLTLSFADFGGTPKELSEAVRKGKISAKELPILSLIEQAFEQIRALGLAERSEVLPILAELVLFKLRAFAKRPVVIQDELEEDGPSAPAFLDTLVALQEAIAFLEQRSRERARILPIPASPLPRDRRLRFMPVQALVRAVEPFARRAELLLEADTFGVREAWERIKGFLWGIRRAWFDRLPFSGWYEQAIAFTSLLEAKKQGDVELYQSENFVGLEVELRRVTTEGSRSSAGGVKREANNREQGSGTRGQGKNL